MSGNYRKQSKKSYGKKKKASQKLARERRLEARRKYNKYVVNGEAKHSKAYTIASRATKFAAAIGIFAATFMLAVEAVKLY